MIPSLTHGLFRRVFLNIGDFLGTTVFVFQLKSIVVIYIYIRFQSLKLIETCFLAQNLIYFGELSMCTFKECLFFCCLLECLLMFVRSQCFTVSYRSSRSVLSKKM